MAIWQFSVDLVPASWLREQVTSLPDPLPDDVDTSEAWERFSLTAASVALQVDNLIGPRNRSWSPALIRWGDEMEDDLQLWTEGGRIVELGARFDVSQPVSDFYFSVALIAVLFDLSVVTSSRQVIKEVTAAALIDAASRSLAACIMVPCPAQGGH